MTQKRTIPRLWRDAVARNSGPAYLVEGPEGWRSVVGSPDGGEVAFWQAKNGH